MRWMYVYEFIKQSTICIVCDDVDNDFKAGFVGPLELTPEGEEHFAAVLKFTISANAGFGNNVAILRLRNREYKDPEDYVRHAQAKEFFEAIHEWYAGKCDKWFKR